MVVVVCKGKNESSRETKIVDNGGQSFVTICEINNLISDQTFMGTQHISDPLPIIFLARTPAAAQPPIVRHTYVQYHTINRTMDGPPADPYPQAASFPTLLNILLNDDDHHHPTILNKVLIFHIIRGQRDDSCCFR